MNIINQSRDKAVMAKVIGLEIYRLRKECAMTGVQLAKILQVSQQQISRYERGVCHITVDALVLILDALHISMAEFFKRVYLSSISHKDAQFVLNYHSVMMPPLEILPHHLSHHDEAFFLGETK
ncbi:DNA-binding helix-turn-helix protein [Providencia rettgeri DSM 1131]|uniref:helix-turn-helix domain-containing protein n=1 Tax=Providencia rettgeri TaxID=587 RepID=UPI0001C34651|nr:helix-turn-helix transcriptional regulator [Providencia rettgeri]EFE51265.1 DNA-binding helix-turn-helix protein [Providencia rettgeri DSM 1131]